MPMTSHRLPKPLLGAAILLVVLSIASCAAEYTAPQQMDSSRPTVTYKYQNDEGLIQANQNAATYCNQYRLASRAASVANDQDGSKVVVFECVASATPAAPSPINPNLTYSYRTDQELLNASRSAQIYCMKSGSQQMTSNILTNADGSRTVTFQCRG